MEKQTKQKNKTLKLNTIELLKKRLLLTKINAFLTRKDDYQKL